MHGLREGLPLEARPEPPPEGRVRQGAALSLPILRLPLQAHQSHAEAHPEPPPELPTGEGPALRRAPRPRRVPSVPQSECDTSLMIGSSRFS